MGRGWVIGVAGAIAVACGSSKNDFDGGDGGDDGPVVCTMPTIVCAGGCVDVTSDPKNCGACGTACSDKCCGGACVNAASCAFAVTRVDPAYGWQNGGDWLTLTGAGFAKGMRVDIGSGRAPVRVIDPKTARILTPP